MSWEPVIPVSHSGGGVGVRASIRIDRALHRNGAGKRLIIALGADVIRTMRWEPGIMMTVLRGSQDDLGKVRLARSSGNKGYKLSRLHSSKGGKHQYGLRLPTWYGMPNEPCRMTTCHWQLSECRSVLEIRLPRWAISDHGFDVAEAAE